MKINYKLRQLRYLIPGEYMLCTKDSDIDFFLSIAPHHNETDLDMEFFKNKLKIKKNGIFMIYMKPEDSYDNNTILYVDNDENDKLFLIEENYKQYENKL